MSATIIGRGSWWSFVTKPLLQCLVRQWGADIIYMDGKVWLDRPHMDTQKPIMSPTFDTGTTGVNSRASSTGELDVWTSFKEYTGWGENTAGEETGSPTRVPDSMEMSTAIGRFIRPCLKLILHCVIWL